MLCFHEDSLDMFGERAILRRLRAPSEGSEGPECLDHASRLYVSRLVGKSLKAVIVTYQQSCARAGEKRRRNGLASGLEVTCSLI